MPVFLTAEVAYAELPAGDYTLYANWNRAGGQKFSVEITAFHVEPGVLTYLGELKIERKNLERVSGVYWITVYCAYERHELRSQALSPVEVDLLVSGLPKSFVGYALKRFP